MRTLVLVDTSWCMHRYYHAHRHLSVDVGGTPVLTGTIFGITSLVQQLRDCYGSNSDLLFCMDSSTQNRKDVFDGYKAARVHNSNVFSRLGDIQSLLSAVPNVGFATAEGCEADDLIAYLALSQRDDYNEIVVFAGDKDFWQLLPYGVKVVNGFNKKKPVCITEQDVEETIGCTSPLLVKMRALTGDAGDGIPAVYHKVRKTLAKAFAEAWTASAKDESLEEIIQKFDVCHKTKQKLLDSVEVIRRNVALMDLTKYQLAENALKFQLFKEEYDETLVEKYRLKAYASFLNTLNVK